MTLIFYQREYTRHVYPSKYSRREPFALRLSEFPAVRSDGSVDPDHPWRELFGSEVLPDLCIQLAIVTDLWGQRHAWPACR
jgi:hypothetical protein